MTFPRPSYHCPIACFDMKMPSYQYGDYHFEDTAILSLKWESLYLAKGSTYWNSPSFPVAFPISQPPSLGPQLSWVPPFQPATQALIQLFTSSHVATRLIKTQALYQHIHNLHQHIHNHTRPVPAQQHHMLTTISFHHRYHGLKSLIKMVAFNHSCVEYLLVICKLDCQQYFSMTRSKLNDILHSINR